MIQYIIVLLEAIIGAIVGFFQGILSVIQNPKALRELVIIGIIAAFSSWFISFFLPEKIGLQVSQFFSIALTTIVFYAGTWKVR